MSIEKLKSIMCETCGGWHATEAHTQYEKEAREKRMAEIKARPDSAYRFDTLGFTSEQKGEIEPWMHEVIKKAKELGDDLQDSDFFIHMGPRKPWRRGDKRVPSVLSLIEQDKFPDETQMLARLHEGEIRPFREFFIAQHDAGQPKPTGWALYKEAEIEELLDLQEHWVKTRDKKNLQEYQRAIRDRISIIVGRCSTLLKDKQAPSAYVDKWREQQTEELAQHIAEGEDLLEKLDSVNGRQEAVKFVMKSHWLWSPVEGVGIIFKITDQIQEEYKQEPASPLEWVNDGKVYFKSKNGDELFTIHFCESKVNEVLSWNTDPEVAKESAGAYREFIHGIFVPHGSVKEQREILERILEITKDSPEKRLPIYNFYGKLVWPRPPEEDK